jgi:hypothetical protein
MGAMDYDDSRLEKAGELRRAGLAQIEEARQIVVAQLKAARKAGRTWRQISNLTGYSELQLQNMAKPPRERARRAAQRRSANRKPAEGDS